MVRTLLVGGEVIATLSWGCVYTIMMIVLPTLRVLERKMSLSQAMSHPYGRNRERRTSVTRFAYHWVDEFLSWESSYTTVSHLVLGFHSSDNILFTTRQLWLKKGSGSVSFVKNMDDILCSYWIIGFHWKKFQRYSFIVHCNVVRKKNP